MCTKLACPQPIAHSTPRIGKNQKTTYLKIQDPILNLALAVRVLLQLLDDAELDLAAGDDVAEPLLQQIVVLKLLPLDLAHQAVKVRDGHGAHIRLPVLAQLRLLDLALGLERGEHLLPVGVQLDLGPRQQLPDLAADRLDLGVVVLADPRAGREADRAAARARRCGRVVQSLEQRVALHAVVDVAAQVGRREQQAQGPALVHVDATVREALGVVHVHRQDVRVADVVELLQPGLAVAALVVLELPDGALEVS